MASGAECEAEVEGGDATTAPRFACIILDLAVAHQPHRREATPALTTAALAAHAACAYASAAHTALLAACRRITPRVEALPDLGSGILMAAEAVHAITFICARFAVRKGLPTRVCAGIGSGLTLAQHAAHHALHSATCTHAHAHAHAAPPVAVLTAEAAPAFLAALPVTALLDPHLRDAPATSAPVLSTETVRRLQR